MHAHDRLDDEVVRHPHLVALGLRRTVAAGSIDVISPRTSPTLIVWPTLWALRTYLDVPDLMTPRQGTAERRYELYEEALAVIARLRERPPDRRRGPRHRVLAPPAAARVRGRRQHELPGAARQGAHARGRRLLARPEIPVQQVAARIGYHQPAQFSKSFRRQFGMSPRAYRHSVAAREGGLGASALLSLRCTTELGGAGVDE